MKRDKQRIYWKFTDTEKDGRRSTLPRRPPKDRVASGKPRAYLDVRDFGEGIEALKEEGERYAVTDPDAAERLMLERLQELRLRDRTSAGTARLETYAKHHRREKKRAGNCTEQWLSAVKRHLDRAEEMFGSETELTDIDVSDVKDWLWHLKEERGLSPGSRRKHIHSLSQLYQRAQSERLVPSGYNPVGDLMTDDMPKVPRREADFLEPHEAALLLEAARLEEPNTDRGALPFAHPLLATYLLTGGRKAEVLGLEREDVDFQRGTIRFKPNRHRRLKNDASDRTIPMWSQLREVLEPYARERIGLLFPSPRTGKMVSDTRKMLDRLLEKIPGMEKGEVRLHGLRHTYTSARIQTTEHGAPVALFTVARELGHSSTQLIERRYGHLLTNRQARGEEVGFRVGPHREELGDRLEKLRKAS